MGNPDIPDEVLDTAPPGRFPRWLAPVAFLVVAAAVATAAALLGGDGPGPAPGPSRRSASPDASARALAASPGSGVFLQVIGDVLSTRRPDGTGTHTSDPLHVSDHRSDRIVLAVDATTGSVWVVPADLNTPGHAEAYSLDDLSGVDRVPVPPHVHYAVASDGALYVASEAGVQLYDGHGHGFAPLSTGPASSLVADPSRHRVLVTGISTDGFTIGAIYGPDVQAGNGVNTGLPPRLAVVAGAIWAGDAVRGKPWLVRLAPDTLRPGRNVADTRFGDGAVIVATGDSSLFVRARGEDGHRLFCLDARTGAVTEQWPEAAGQVAATDGHALLAPVVGPPRPLALGPCAG